MPQISRQIIEQALASYIDPYLQQNLLAAKAVKTIEIDEHSVKIGIVLGYPFERIKSSIVHELNQLLKSVTGHRQITIQLSCQIETHIGQKGIKALLHIKNIIAVGSGKGGVGKSTTAVNLALALAQEGARVAILDADIYGPSQPTMLGIHERPEASEEKKIQPHLKYGIQSMSIGYLIDTHTAMIWRGPMVSTALQQLLNDTQWDNLDYLVIDLPPGTGDIQLTMAQKIPVSGAVIVTTPQDLALLDARRAIEMFRKVNIPVLGMIENMSIHHCSQCGHAERIFGEGGGKQLASEYSVDLLGVLPLDKAIREQTDAGKPPVAFDPESQYAKLYADIARRTAAKLSLQPRDYSGKFPEIIVK